MTEAAITLPLETVEHLLVAAREYARQWAKPNAPILEAIETTEAEVAHVRQLLHDPERKDHG